MNIGVLLIATGRYIDLFAQLHASFEKYFLCAHSKTYFLFTDFKGALSAGVQRLLIRHKKWPYGTLYRYHHFLTIAPRLRSLNIEALYFCDVDMHAVAEVGEEILPTQAHPLIASSFHSKDAVGLAHSYERNPQSKAYVPNYETHYLTHPYLCGGFQGGATEEFLIASECMKQNIDADSAKGIIAHRHDQSHWNRYYVDNPTKFKVLGEEYCYYPHNVQPHLSPRIEILLKDTYYYRYGSFSGLLRYLVQKAGTAFRLLRQAKLRVFLQKALEVPHSLASVISAIFRGLKRS